MTLESGLVNPINVVLFVAGEQGRLADLFFTSSSRGISRVERDLSAKCDYPISISRFIVPCHCKRNPPIVVGRVDVWMAACLVC